MNEPDSAAASLQAGIPIRNLWYMLLYAWDLLHLRGRWAADVESAPTLDALFASILANLVKQRFRIGLGQDYRQHQALIRGIRGRIDFAQSLRRLAFQHGRASCQFQIYSANVPKNQIIRSTLARLIHVGDFGPQTSKGDELRHGVRWLVRNLDSIDLVELMPEFVRREQLRRHDPDYRLMLAICQLVAHRQMPTEKSGNERLLALDRDPRTLFGVFEKFVANFYKVHLKGWSVIAQKQFKWPVTESSAYLPVLSPDLVLQHRASRRMIVLDTKFTAAALTTGRWDKLTFRQSHLYQIYAYLRSQEEESPAHRAATGILLYPAATHSLSETIKLQGHCIRWETIDLSLSWEDIEENLISLINE